MKIYTKTGDTGHTSLAKGGRVLKSDIRVEMYGTCDELNSNLGLVLSFLENEEYLQKEINLIQNLLFEIGSELAGYKKDDIAVSSISQSDIEHIEKSIDILEEKLIPLKSFILPGGTKTASLLHVSRTICRRLERIMVEANSSSTEIFSSTLIFINRLSDFLFVSARYANSISGVNETLWTSRLK